MQSQNKEGATSMNKYFSKVYAGPHKKQKKKSISALVLSFKSILGASKLILGNNEKVNINSGCTL